MLGYKPETRRVNAPGVAATTKSSQIVVNADPGGQADASDPAELSLAPAAACIKGTEPVVTNLHFDVNSVSIAACGVREDSPCKRASIDPVSIDMEASAGDQACGPHHGDHDRLLPAGWAAEMGGRIFPYAMAIAAIAMLVVIVIRAA